MTDYQAQAKQFLADCKATMEINFIGKEIPSNWLGETKPHNKYQFTITTPKGKYTSYFWDSHCAATNICRDGRRDFVIDLLNEVKALIKERDEAVAELAALKEKSEN